MLSFHQQTIKRCRFNPDEDAQLREIVTRISAEQSSHFKWNWKNIAAQFNAAMAKSNPQGSAERDGRCLKERWEGYLRPGLESCEFAPDEDAFLLEGLVEKPLKRGETPRGRWTILTAQLPGRSAVAIRKRASQLCRNFGWDVDKMQNAVLTMKRDDIKFGSFGDDGDCIGITALEGDALW
jgi:hypothetical protein